MLPTGLFPSLEVGSRCGWKCTYCQLMRLAVYLLPVVWLEVYLLPVVWLAVFLLPVVWLAVYLLPDVWLAVYLLPADAAGSVPVAS
jgi:hypothetical protein